MTILTPPTWLENSAVHNAQDYRTMLASLVAGEAGVVDPAAFKVTERAGTPNMSVDVAAGGLFVASTRSSSAGVYHVYNDGTVNVPLSAADATNPRIDRVLVQVRDEEQDAALTQNDARVLVVEGTPAASPSAPTITVEDYVELAQITVPASASSITDSDVDDVRTAAPTWSRSRGAVAYAEVTSNQSGFGAGPTDITGLSVTFTAKAGRRYKVTGAADFGSIAELDQFNGLIRTGGGTTLGRFGRIRGGNTSDATRMYGSVRVAPGAGSVTYKLSFERSSGSGTGSMSAAADNPAFIHVEDVGGFVP